MNDKQRFALVLAVALALALAMICLWRAPQADAQTPSVTMLWTATGDDSTVGRASVDSLRYSRNPVGVDTLGWWNAAFIVPGMPVPSTAGATDSVRVQLGAWSQVYYFILKVCDEVPNCGGWSNVAAYTTPGAPDLTPPGRAKNLRNR